MDLGPHATFIIASYAVSALILGALIGWIVFDWFSLRRTLAELEARGITRRSSERAAPAQRSAA